ncbi:MAG: UDP-N-acetylmuramate dehydrogenase [Fimbriimonadaceae bacterium]
MVESLEIRQGVKLAPYTTLNAGGEGEYFAVAETADQLAEAAAWAFAKDLRCVPLGWGSNVLPSDAGVGGLIVLNLADRIEVDPDGTVTADTGVGFQELCIKTMQHGLAGLEFAVGIPGTLGGALVSNAGAYRSNVSEFLTDLEVVHDGDRKWVLPDLMNFSYRDSVLRRLDPPAITLVRVKMRLPRGSRKESFDEARDYQRKRISKQPPPASAGSFFKNVYDQDLADRLENLPENLRAAGVVPAGYLLEEAGMKGFRHGGAALGEKHANFMLNVNRATATEIRELADYARKQVRKAFGAELQEEVLYLGDWSGYRAH